MLELLRFTRRALAALLLAGGLGQAAVAAPVLSNSGTLQFEVLSASYLSGNPFSVEVIAVGQNNFRIQRAGGDPLVPLGDNLSLIASVTAVSGSIASWTGQLIGDTEGSMGESVEDIAQTLGLGLITVTGAAPNGSITFSPQTGLLITKDINATDGEIIAVLQGTELFSTAVPEPFGLALIGTGLVGLVAVRRRRATA